MSKLFHVLMIALSVGFFALATACGGEDSPSSDRNDEGETGLNGETGGGETGGGETGGGETGGGATGGGETGGGETGGGATGGGETGGGATGEPGLYKTMWKCLICDE